MKKISIVISILSIAAPLSHAFESEKKVAPPFKTYTLSEKALLAIIQDLDTTNAKTFFTEYQLRESDYPFAAFALLFENEYLSWNEKLKWLNILNKKLQKSNHAKTVLADLTVTVNNMSKKFKYRDPEITSEKLMRRVRKHLMRYAILDSRTALVSYLIKHGIYFNKYDFAEAFKSPDIQLIILLYDTLAAHPNLLNPGEETLLLLASLQTPATDDIALYSIKRLLTRYPHLVNTRSKSFETPELPNTLVDVLEHKIHIEKKPAIRTRLEKILDLVREMGAKSKWELEENPETRYQAEEIDLD